MTATHKGEFLSTLGGALREIAKNPRQIAGYISTPFFDDHVSLLMRTLCFAKLAQLTERVEKQFAKWSVPNDELARLCHL
ncbi:MAG: hypothetical protein MN733_21920 [Nitrososphaera sp.]|nr:hypothetical protein [Nitrososphaera sp.]